MGAKSKKQTIGFRYYMSLHGGLCVGDIDEMNEIEVGDLHAWPGEASETLPDADITLTNTTELYALPGFYPVGTIVAVFDDPDLDLNGRWQKSAGGWIQISHLLDEVPGATLGGTGQTYINAPNLFGGDKREGGIQGKLWLGMGLPDQVLPTWIKDIIAISPLPEFRGVVTVFFDGLVSAMNPYLKEWRFRCNRSLKGWYGGTAWYPAKARICVTGSGGKIIKGMNGAHIIYQCATDPRWGRGLPAELIDENSFIAAANQLCAEGFALCFNWTRQEDLDVFVATVINHIGAAQYISRQTGLYTLRLIRDDYVVEDLPLWNYENGLLSVEEDENASPTTAFNEIIVKYVDPNNRGQDASTRAQNLGAFHTSKSAATTPVTYVGIPTAELANRVAVRDLKSQAAGLRRFKLTFDRRAWRIEPGMPFRISAPDRDVNEMVVRAGNINPGSQGSNKGLITIGVVEDVFGLPAASYVAAPTSDYTAPSTTPEASPHRRLDEANYRDLFQQLTADELAAVTPDQGFIELSATAPSSLSRSFDLWTKAGGEDYEPRGSGEWSPTATLAADVDGLETEWTIAALTGYEVDAIGSCFLIDDEICKIVAFNPEAGTMTVARGCVDTVPAPHVSPARLWFNDANATTDDRAYVTAEVVSVKALTVTSAGTLPLSTAPANTLTIANRHYLPYPPGNVRITGAGELSIFDTLEASYPTGFDLDWSHRDRLISQDNLVDQTEGDVGPEAGTTYTVRRYDPAFPLVVLATTSAIAGTTWTYDAGMIAADGSLDSIIIELESVRDGLPSFQRYRFEVPLT
jgi:hypothetical protein